MNEGCVKAETKLALFGEVIVRLENLASEQNDLVTRAYNKSIKIAATGLPQVEKKPEKPTDSIIGALNSIMDKIDINNGNLLLVVHDLENSIM